MFLNVTYVNQAFKPGAPSCCWATVAMCGPSGRVKARILSMLFFCTTCAQEERFKRCVLKLVYARVSPYHGLQVQAAPSAACFKGLRSRGLLTLTTQSPPI